MNRPQPFSSGVGRTFIFTIRVNVKTGFCPLESVLVNLVQTAHLHIPIISGVQDISWVGYLIIKKNTTTTNLVGCGFLGRPTSKTIFNNGITFNHQLYIFEVETRAVKFVLLLETHTTYVTTIILLRWWGYHLVELHSPFYCLNWRCRGCICVPFIRCIRHKDQVARSSLYRVVASGMYVPPTNKMSLKIHSFEWSMYEQCYKAEKNNQQRGRIVSGVTLNLVNHMNKTECVAYFFRDIIVTLLTLN